MLLIEILKNACLKVTLKYLRLLILFFIEHGENRISDLICF